MRFPLFRPPLRPRLLGTALVWGFCFLCGCSSSDQPATAPAAGKVLFEGRPLPHALVIFHPRGGDANFPRPRAQAGVDGTFAVQTFVANDGLPAGEYDVTVECWRSPGGDAPPVNRLPVRFASTASSGLRATIRPESNVLPPFELKK